MKKSYIRKSLALFVAVTIFLVSYSTNVFALPRIIDENIERQYVTSGVLLEKVNRFSVSGWQQMDILKVDLSNENVKVDTLVNKKAINETSSVKNLAKNSGALAAVNGSFFDFGSGSKGYAYGPIISSGSPALASYRNNSDLATFSLDNMNNALFKYWNTKVELITPLGERMFIGSYNRNSQYYNDITIVDKKYGNKSLGVSSHYPDWFEVVVVDGIVSEFRSAQPAVAIPDNGYVLMTRAPGKAKLTSAFKIGDPISYELTMNVDTSNMQMALTGGSLLLQDGNIVKRFTHLPDGTRTRAPRTAIGTSKDGKTLFAVTVDGRSSKSIGMTQMELAEYLKSIGCYYAINMDGGGSTTMVAREAGHPDLQVINNPSDGYARGVSASLGIFSVAPQGPLDTLRLEAYEDNVFVNTSRAFTVKGVDRYLNPVDLNYDDIEWSVSGVSGSFKGNTFYPTSVGEAVVTAKIGEATGSCNISVLSAPVRMELNRNNLNTEIGKTSTFSVKGWNKNGYSSSIHPSHAKWSVSGNIGMFSANNFTATKSGSGYVSASIGATSVHCPVSVYQKDIVKVIDTFGVGTLKLDTSSKEVSASYTRATNHYKSPSYSGKLTYNFNKPAKTNRAAYINFPNGGVKLAPNTSKLGVWVYSATTEPVWIGAMIVDGNGTVQYEYLTRGVSWTGWKYLDIPLNKIKSPQKIIKLYTVQPDKTTKTSGTFYFDDLTMTYSGYPDVNLSKVPRNTVPNDEHYKDTYVSGSDSFSFSVFGQSRSYSSSDKTQTAMLNSLSSRINRYLQASVVVGNADNLSKHITAPKLTTTASYRSLDKNGNRLIQLDSRKGGLRSSSSEQWLWLKNQLNSFNGNNVFVFLSNNTSNFRDSHEAALLKETFTNFKKKTGKNIWVCYNGTTNSSYMDRGVKYVSTAGLESLGFSSSNKSAAKFVTVKVKGTDISYQFKSF